MLVMIRITSVSPSQRRTKLLLLSSLCLTLCLQICGLANETVNYDVNIILQWWKVTDYIYSSTVLKYYFYSTKIQKYCTFYSTTFI